MKNEPMRTLTISLSEKQVVLVQDAVETGEYASSSEVVREALGLWEQRERIIGLDIARLKRAYDEGMASGEGRVLDASMLDELRMVGATDATIEKWLVEDVIPTLNAHDADPGRALSAEDVRRNVRAHMAKRS